MLIQLRVCGLPRPAGWVLATTGFKHRQCIKLIARKRWFIVLWRCPASLVTPMTVLKRAGAGCYQHPEPREWFSHGQTWPSRADPATLTGREVVYTRGRHVPRTANERADAGRLERRSVPLSQIVANPRNPRKHPQDQIDRLAASLKRFGQTKPVMIRKADHVLIAGHGIWEAAKRAGVAELDCYVWDTDEKTADAYMLADNRHGDLSSPDGDRVASILREIDQADYLAVGFDADEVAGLLGDLDADSLIVEEIDTNMVDDRAWVSIRCPLASQARMLQRLKDVMADFPDVEVDLGTVASV